MAGTSISVIMSIIGNIKQSPRVRGLLSFYREYFGFSRKSFGFIGERVVIIPPCNIVNPKNVFLYGNNKIEHCTISTSLAKFVMKKGAGTAEGLTVHTGNHLRVVGCFYRDVTNADKQASGQVLDKDVVIEEDAWVGCNVTLLSGVTIGRGATIAAGAVVSKSMPPYCVCGGIPCKPLKFYWTIDQILEHEQKLYPVEDRYTREQLEEIFEKYKK